MRLKEFLARQTHLEYHDTLNPVIWHDDQLIPEVEEALKRIADNFIEFLGMPADKITDIIITGSNCNYNYSDLSDIDLHLVASYDATCMDCAGLSADDCLKTKKTLWNDQHDVTIHGYTVEVYVQPESDKLTSNAGIYSLRNLKWINHPVREVVDLSNDEILIKAQPIMDAIDNIVENEVDDKDTINDIKDKIKKMRNAGLQQGGEFSIENLAFKVIRNEGYLQKLYDYEAHLEDMELSLK